MICLIERKWVACLFVFCMLFAYSCGSSSPSIPPPDPVILPPPPPTLPAPFEFRETGRSFLVGTEPEQEFAMYTYLLFSGPPNEHNSERYRAAVQIYLTFNPAEEIASYENYKAEHLNVFYMPVRSVPKISEEADSLLRDYNYTRSQIILNTLPGSANIDTNRGGPYLLSSLEPMTNVVQIPEPYLVQDLSTVPPHIIELWFDEFFKELKNERPWSEKAMDTVVLNLRTNIAKAACGWPVVESAVYQFITLFPSVQGK